MRKIIFPGKNVLGILVYVSLNNFVAWVIFPYIVIVYGNIILVILAIFSVSILSRYLMIIIYDHLKEDWFFIEAIKDQSGDVGENHITKKIKKYKTMGNIVLYFILVMTDSVITVIYARSGAYKWNRFGSIPSSRKVRILFLISNILGALIAGLGYSFIFYLIKKAGFF